MYKAMVLAGFVGTVFVSGAVSYAQKPGSRAALGGGMAPVSQPQPGQAEGGANAAQIQQGATLFNQHCVTCHDANKSLRASNDISGWRATVQKMSTKKDANIPQEAHEPIAQYLASLSAGPSAAGGGAGSAMSAFGQLLGGFSAPSDEAQAPTLKDQAVFAFQSGNPKQAYAMLEAYALQASDEEAMAVLKDYRWATHHKRPQLGLNFAVGVTIKNPQNAEEIAPIGVVPANNSGGGFPGGQPGMGGAKSGGRSGAPATVLVVNSLEDAAGTFGTQFIEAMKTKHDEGVWSMAFREYGLGAPGGFGGPFAGGGMPPGMPQPGFGGGAPGFSGNGAADQPNSVGSNGPPNGYNGGNGGMRPNSTSSNGPPQGYNGGSGGMRPNSTSSNGPPAGYNGGSGGMRPNSTSSNGPPAGYNGGSGGMRPNSTSSNGPPAGYNGGNGGMKPDSGASGGGSSAGATKAPLQFPQQGGFFDPDGPQGGAPGPGGRGPGSRNAAGPSGAMPPSFGAGASALAPCMTFIGSDDTTKLVKKAIAEGYDALIIFEVDLQVNRLLKTVINDTRIRVLLPAENAKDTKAVLTSKRLNNVQARKSAAKGESDGVDEAVELIVKKIEETFGLHEIPAALSPEIVSNKRIPALVADKSVPVLDRLSEVNLYYANGLIDENQKAAAFEKIAGQQGATIATGTPEEKLAAVEKLLQREFK